MVVHLDAQPTPCTSVQGQALLSGLKKSMTFPACVEGRHENCPGDVDRRRGRALCVCACHEDDDIGDPRPW
jgi:hypothetical protein